MIIDTHAHFVPAAFLETLRAERRLFPSVEVLKDGPQTRMAFAGGAPTRPVAPRLSDLKQRKEWLGAQGIDCQMAGGWLDLFGYELPPEEGADWARFMNEAMLKGAGELPALAPLATVPLQNGALAAKVLGEALDAGFRGAMIGTQPRGSRGALDDPDLDPFWDVASARKATLFVHPMFGCGDERLNGFDLINAVGRATDTITAMARLLYSGHLQRFPGLRLVISHGGGGLPYLLGRLRRNNAIHPGEYADALDGFRRLYFDTVLFEPRALRFLCDCAGADKVVLGSDHPFPIGDDKPLRVVEDTPLTTNERSAILGDTARGLFGFA
ncbi:MAG TPA: amidohydrolase family protein [Stellaceae bacterium]|nr:amidohydrolase family protein [Stellaceae bacterium]